MRLHSLQVTAFGPFAGTEDLDFDALNDAGLFLLAGATGAGKTSILDAVCFALYGSVPGARGVKVLKSQHADDRVSPEVVLDFSVRDRRFVVRRSPEWSRPKKRGTGLRTEKAAASLLEVTAHGERLLSHRAAEVGLMVSELVGMQATQFWQVAMLPQGEFQRFLRASTSERHEVLQHLFQTGRFARIEDWVHEHSRHLRERSASGGRTVQRILATVADRAGVDLPEELAESVPGPACLAWAERHRDDAEKSLAETRTVAAHAAAETTRARDHLEATRHTAQLVHRRDEARARLAALDGRARELSELRRQLDADVSAAGCGPVLDLLDRAGRELDSATVLRDRLLAELPSDHTDHTDDAEAPQLDLGLVPTVERLAELERSARATLTTVEGLLPVLRRVRDDEVRLGQEERALDAAVTERAQLQEARDALPARRREVHERHEAARGADGRLEALRLRADGARARLVAARAVPDVQARLLARQDDQRDARDAAADARDRLQQLTQRRLDGMAAELAADLHPGDPCQVCGSPDHPVPATPGADRVTPADQQAARTAADAAAGVVERLAGEVKEVQQQLGELRTRAEGRDPATALEERQAISRQLEVATGLADELPALGAERDRLAAEAEGVEQRIRDLDLRAAQLSETVQARRAAAGEAREEIRRQLPDAEDPEDLAEVTTRLRARVSTLEGLLEAQRAHDRAASRVAELEAQAGSAAAERGFTTLTSARAALLSDDARAAAKEMLTRHGETTAAATAVLAEPDVAALADGAGPDVGAARGALERAETESQRADRTLHHREQRAEALRDQVFRLEEELDRWAPAQQDAERADAMSKLVRGLGSDNQLQMRLSAYVLATRLDQVLAAANERLSHMRDQRYLLQRTDRAHRKGSQAGLGLEVLDQWTGDVRDPATLSGGETFVISLSLALGLADVVSQESGGTEIETLFVDEGFGTLDAETLDDVMDRLDALRAGGRSVGVVSHVTELRSRIPAQVHVRKTPTGSSISSAPLVG